LALTGPGVRIPHPPPVNYKGNAMKEIQEEGLLEVIHQSQEDILTMCLECIQLANSLENVGMSKVAKVLRLHNEKLAVISERIGQAYSKDISEQLAHGQKTMGNLLTALLNKAEKESEVNPPYFVYHWDTFDGQVGSILIGKKEGYPSILEADRFIREHYGERLCPSGADKVEVVNKFGQVVARFPVK
jgi:hypothetical protein